VAADVHLKPGGAPDGSSVNVAAVSTIAARSYGRLSGRKNDAVPPARFVHDFTR
jgi:hypothetical protein